eukprot:11897413-Alexandrium_andersonii.AAC.1
MEPVGRLLRADTTDEDGRDFIVRGDELRPEMFGGGRISSRRPESRRVSKAVSPYLRRCPKSRT